MQVCLDNILKPNDTVAVALSGGCDSMCLLHFLCQNAQKYGYSVVAINVEHGIRGQASINDTNFVKDYCSKLNIPLISYSVDAPKYASENKLSLEQSARILRYDCFYDALKSNKCTKIATAHHRDDNVESVLFNIFRGTGLKGLSGIKSQREDNIVRPFLSVDRLELEEYAKRNAIPFVTDQTNLSDDYTRNFIRLNVIPKIKEIFPELNQSIQRLSDIAQTDDEYLTGVAKKLIILDGETARIPLPCHSAIFSRAIILALKAMGVKKDWEKSHIDSINRLATLNNGAKISLLDGITAIKEYDKIVFFRAHEKPTAELKFSLGNTAFLGKTLSIKEENKLTANLKTGLKADLAKIPNTAVIRTRRDGDVFTKFGGGTKLLNDYFTDKKIAQRARDSQILIADGNVVLAILGLAISDKIKVEDSTQTIISFNILD